MPKVLAFGFETKFSVAFQSLAIDDAVVLPGDAVQAQIGAKRALGGRAIQMTALDVIERRGAEGERGLIGRAAAAEDVDIGGDGGGGSRRNRGLGDKALLGSKAYVG